MSCVVLVSLADTLKMILVLSGQQLWRKLPPDFHQSVKGPRPPHSGSLRPIFRSCCEHPSQKLRLWLFSLQKHLSKQQQSQRQVPPDSAADSDWQKSTEREFLRLPLERNHARVQEWPQLGLPPPPQIGSIVIPVGSAADCDIWQCVCGDKNRRYTCKDTVCVVSKYT